MRSLLTRSRHHPAYPLHAHRHRQTSTMLTWRISPTASLDTHRGLSYGRDADNTPCFCALQGAWRAANAGIEGFPGLGPSSGRTGHVRSRPRQGGRTPFPLYRTLSAGTPQIGGAGGDQVVDLLKYGLNITAGNGILSGSWLIGTSKAPKRNGTHFRL
jgi:hypothetical protein